MEGEVKVSVLMLAYNQEQYIDEAIRSVMLQRTSFPIELIIGDDHSTDGTLARCKAWQQRFPRQIVVHENAENMGLARNFIATFSLARGEYIAICEADDYWCDARKLQIQADFMDANPAYSMCFHRVWNLYEASKTMSLSNGGQRQEVSMHDIALRNPITNVSVFYRRRLAMPLPEWMTEVTSYDFIIHMLCSQHGPVRYMSRPMAVYRKLETSIWTGGDWRKRAFISMKNRDLLIDHFLSSNQEVVDILRKANSRNCLNMSLLLEKAGNSSEADGFLQKARTYMPEWSDADISSERASLSVSEGRRPLLKRILSSCRKAVSRLLPRPRIHCKAAGSITIVPSGGLCNRMKAVSAAVSLAQECRSRLTIIWFRDTGLSARYDQLFGPLQIYNVSLREATVIDRLVYDRPRRHNLWLPLIFQRLFFQSRMGEQEATKRMYASFNFASWASGKHVWLSSHVYFISAEIPDDSFDIFHPLPYLQQRIDAITASFGAKTIGVHVRRTDLERSKRQSPTSMFIARMAREPHDVSFYLASDDVEVKDELRKAFPERVMTLPRKAERNTLEGMEDAEVELYTLSRCQRIIGSYGSTYSLTAAAIGRRPIEIINKEEA